MTKTVLYILLGLVIFGIATFSNGYAQVNLPEPTILIKGAVTSDSGTIEEQGISQEDFTQEQCAHDAILHRKNVYFVVQSTEVACRAKGTHCIWIPTWCGYQTPWCCCSDRYTVCPAC